MIGNSNNSHAILVHPDLHIKFNIHVQNRIYTNLTKKIAVTFVTSHSYAPKQYTSTLFRFCMYITTNNNMDIAKYITAGTHKFLSPTIDILYIH
jgi:hypothetical protein